MKKKQMLNTGAKSISRRRFIKRTFWTLSALTAADALWFERYNIEMNHFYLASATASTKNLKILQLSDLHLRSFNYPTQSIAETVNHLQPDLIAITGDAIDNAEHIPLLRDFMQALHKDIPKVAILGNWEYWGKVNLMALERVYMEHNCSLLINQSKQYILHQRSVAISGVDDFVGGNADIKQALQEYKESSYHIILNHCPQYYDSIIKHIGGRTPADVVLSGHTHGGQVNILGFSLFYPQGSGKYRRGWYADAAPPMYVSKGIGSTILPLRFGARAEISVFHFPLV